MHEQDEKDVNVRGCAIVVGMIILVLMGFVLIISMGGVSATKERLGLIEPIEDVEPTRLDLVSTPSIVTKLVQTVPEPEPEPKTVSLGMFEVTAYCACVKCCGKTDGITKSGEPAKANHTVAADLAVLPMHSEIEIEGLSGTRKVKDIGGAIKSNKIDVYMASHAEALEWGRRKLEVKVVEWGKG